MNKWHLASHAHDEERRARTLAVQLME